MFGLRNRGSLPKIVEQEFENLVAKLKALWLTEHNEDGTHRITPRGFDFVPTGAIQAWPTNTAPEGWVFCRGQALSRVDYKGLFDIIGTTYGTGDGSTTFNVPDLQQRFPLGKAAAGTGATLGATGGAIDHTHTSGALSGATGSGGAHTHTISGSTANESSHTHSFSGTTDVGDLNQAANAGVNQSIQGQDHVHPFSGTTGAGSAHSHGAGSLAGDSGGAHTHDAGTLAMAATGTNNPPYQVVNYIILTGVS